MPAASSRSRWLPPRDVLIAQLVGTMAGPLTAWSRSSGHDQRVRSRPHQVAEQRAPPARPKALDALTTVQKAFEPTRGELTMADKTLTKDSLSRLSGHDRLSSARWSRLSKRSSA